MVSRRRLDALAVSLLSIVFLAGCGGQNIVTRIEEEPPVGVWIPHNAPPGVSLEVSADGTFFAHEWPERLGCRGPEYENINVVDWKRGRDISGVWRARDSTLTFIPATEECNTVLSITFYGVGGQANQGRIYLSPMAYEKTEDDKYVLFLDPA